MMPEISDDMLFWCLTGLAVAIASWGLVQILLGLFRPERRKIQERINLDWKRDLEAGVGRVSIQKQADELPGFFDNNPILRTLNRNVRQAFPALNLGRFLGITLFSAAAGFVIVFMV